MLILPDLQNLRIEIQKADLFKTVGEILPPSTWLIHFTTQPAKVIQEGFRFGETAIHRLALTWDKNQRPKAHPGPGFNFAFEALDPDGAGPRWDPLSWPIASISSDEAILFQAPGLVTTHHDDFEQVILRGEDANFTGAKILHFLEDEFEGPYVQVFSPQMELLDSGMNEDYPTETITKWCQP